MVVKRISVYSASTDNQFRLSAAAISAVYVLCGSLCCKAAELRTTQSAQQLLYQVIHLIMYPSTESACASSMQHGFHKYTV